METSAAGAALSVIFTTGNCTAACPLDPVWEKVRVDDPLVRLPTMFCRVQVSVAEAVPFQYVPLQLKDGEFCVEGEVAAVVLAHVHAAGVVWLKVEVKAAFATVRLAV